MEFRKDIDFSSHAAIGARNLQEDYSSFSSDSKRQELIAVLADGMGGHNGGEVASKKAVDSFQATFKAYPSAAVATKLGACLNQANTDIAIASRNSPALNGMGCTLVGIHIGEQGLQWISVGDSPLFLYRNGSVTRLNADHSMTPVIEESMRKGKITKDEALRHPDRHALRSAVTGEALSMIDSSVKPVGLLKSDIVVLASDGLLTLSVSEIAKVIKDQAKNEAKEIANALVGAVLAKQKSRQDNTTVQVFVANNALGKATTSVSPLVWTALLISVLAIITYFIFSFKEVPFKLPKLSEFEEKPPTVVTPTSVPAIGEVQAASAPAKPASSSTNEPSRVDAGGAESKPTVPVEPSKQNSKEKGSAGKKEKQAVPTKPVQHSSKTPVPNVIVESAGTASTQGTVVKVAPPVVNSSVVTKDAETKPPTPVLPANDPVPLKGPTPTPATQKDSTSKDIRVD
jgi:protein phosphatase